MLDNKFKNLVETLIQTDIFALDTIFEVNLSLKKQQEKLNSMRTLLQEAENSFSKKGMANESEKLIRDGISSLLDTLQVIVLFAKPNEAGNPMLPMKYRENITVQLREAHKKFLDAMSKLHLHNEIPTHEKVTEYVHKIFQDATKLVTDVLEKPGRKEQQETYREYENKARTNSTNSFATITAPHAYRTMVTKTLTQANPTLESEALRKLIEDTIKSETTAMERTIQILGGHARKYDKEGVSEKELGKRVLKSIEQVEALVRTTLVQHIAGLIKIEPRFSVEPVDPVKLKRGKNRSKSQWLFNLFKKKIIQLKEIVINVEKTISVGSKPTKRDNRSTIVPKTQFEVPTKTTSGNEDIIKGQKKTPFTAPERKPSTRKAAMTTPSKSSISKSQKKLSSDISKKETSTLKANDVLQQKKEVSTQTENIAQQKTEASTQTENIVQQKKEVSTQTENIAQQKTEASTQTENIVQQKTEVSTQTENIMQQKVNASTQTKKNIFTVNVENAVEGTQSHR